jgi:hypothetical protein
MLKEAFEYVVSLGQKNCERDLLQAITAQYDGTDQSYLHQVDAGPNGRTLGKVVAPFHPAKIEVTTLTGFVDALQSGLAGDKEKLKSSRLIHVEDYLTVSLQSLTCDKYGVRDKLVVAKYTPVDAFKFDEYYGDPAKFIIGIQVAFYQTDNSVNLIKLASGLTAQSSCSVDDDGLGQQVTINAGAVTSKSVPIPPRIKLIPRRTFDEMSPVESEFLIRFKQSPGQTPMIAIFSVDGTKWQGECMRSIKSYLEKNDHLKGVPVLA